MISPSTSSAPKSAESLPREMDAALNYIRLADRSRRCFVLGLIATAPILGLPAAVEIMRIFRATARETGEQWKHGPFIASFICGWGLLIAIYPLAGFTLTYGFFCIELALLGWLFVAAFRRTQPRTINPSRRWLFAGLALAYGQIFTLAPVVLWMTYLIHSR